MATTKTAALVIRGGDHNLITQADISLVSVSPTTLLAQGFPAVTAKNLRPFVGRKIEVRTVLYDRPVATVLLESVHEDEAGVCRFSVVKEDGHGYGLRVVSRS
jgi:hypothetical protein